MIQIMYIALLAILLSSFTGCAPVEPCVPLTKYVYIEHNVSDAIEKPTPREFELIVLNINDQYFYAMTEDNAKIFSTNWIEYKHWAETNYKLLKNAK